MAVGAMGCKVKEPSGRWGNGRTEPHPVLGYGK